MTVENRKSFDGSTYDNNCEYYNPSETGVANDNEANGRIRQYTNARIIGVTAKEITIRAYARVEFQYNYLYGVGQSIYCSEVGGDLAAGNCGLSSNPGGTWTTADMGLYQSTVEFTVTRGTSPKTIELCFTIWAEGYNNNEYGPAAFETQRLIYEITIPAIPGEVYVYDSSGNRHQAIEIYVYDSSGNRHKCTEFNVYDSSGNLKTVYL